MTANPAALLYFVFEGHPDRYGLGGTAGGAVVGDAYEATCQHFHKGVPIGIYPMRDDGLVRWGCSDFDTKDAWADAQNVKFTLGRMGIASFVEISRSKGYHLWVFADRFIPAADMRRTLLFAHSKAGIPPREVNPKQEKPGPKGYGNYVRLPYVGGTADSNGRRIMVNPNHVPIEFPRFYEYALANMVPPTVLSKWADKYKPPAPPKPIGNSRVAMSPTVLSSLNKWCRKVLDEGPADWRMEDGMGGRSGALARLAHECRKSGVDAATALAVVRYADDRWGKYVDRANRDEILEGLVGRAY